VRATGTHLQTSIARDRPDKGLRRRQVDLATCVEAVIFTIKSKGHIADCSCNPKQ